MDRLNERLALTAALTALLMAGVDLAFRAGTGLRVFSALAAWLLIAAGVGLLALVRAWLARRTDEERQDAALASAAAPDTSLFRAREGEPEPFSIARTQRQFERFAAYGAPVLFALLQGLAAWRAHRDVALLPAYATGRHLIAASALAAQTFVLFLLSRYLLGLGRMPARRVLRGPGILLGASALAGLPGIAAGVAAEAGYPAADRIAALLLTAVLAVLAVESLWNLIAEIYRPRRAAAEERPAYESRLARLLCDPSAWFGSAAASLDYQFGFKVSQTWLFRFVRQTLVPLLIFQILLMYLLSCVVILDTEEEGVLERLGMPRAEAAGGWQLGPGLHLKWPWPFETVRRFPARRLQTIHIGYSSGETKPPEVMLWTKPHFEREDEFLTADPAAQQSATAGGDAVSANLLSFNVPIEYRIRDLRAYAYNHADPPAVLRAIAYRCAAREAAGRSLFDIMGEGRSATALALHKRIQAEADREGLGVAIEFVGFQGIHPPVQVAEAFEEVVGAIEEKESAVYKAEAYRSRRVPVAVADAEKAVYAARGYRDRRVEVAAAEAEQFVVRKKAADISPDVFRNRYYLEALGKALAGARKFIVVANPQTEVLQFNFEEKTPASLLDFSPDAAPEGGTP